MVPTNGNATDAPRMEEERRRHDEQKATPSVFERARNMVNCYATESLHSRAVTRAVDHAEKAARLERLAQALTPEVERTIWALQEGLALGVIAPDWLLDALNRVGAKRSGL